MPRDEYGTVYLDQPGVAGGSFVCRNKDQVRGRRIPMPYSANYEINLGKTAYMTADNSFSFVNAKQPDPTPAPTPTPVPTSTVAPTPEPKPVPKTGDNTNLTLLTALLLATGPVIFSLLLQKKKESESDVRNLFGPQS